MGKTDSRRKNARDPAATVSRILQVAREEFGAKGFDGTKIEHIARGAGVSKQLIYVYFVSKDELYGEMLKQLSRETYEGLLKIDFDAMDPETAIKTYIEALYDRYQASPVMAVVTMDQSLHDGAQIRLAPDARRMRETLWTRVGGALSRGIAEGVFAASMDMETLEFMTVIIVVGCVSSRGMFTRYIGRSPAQDETARFDRDYASTFILRALRG